MQPRPAPSRSDGSTRGGLQPSTLPAFALLFSVSLKGDPRRADFDSEAMRAALAAHVTPFAPAELAAYQRLRDEADAHVLGMPFMEAQRLAHRPIGRVMLGGEPAPSLTPRAAEVHLFTHVAGVALWELWLPAPQGAFDVDRWNAWLDADAPDSLPAKAWQMLEPMNRALGATAGYHQYLPCSVVRLPDRPLTALTEGNSGDIVRLLWRDRSTRPLKREVVEAELARDYCAREGGITLLGRRAALDIHGNEDEAAAGASDRALPPKSAMPFLVTLELLMIERAVLLHLHDRLSQTVPTTIKGLLDLKRQVADGLEEYYGATLASTRFGDAVAEDGERLLGIVDAYDALMDRLETVSFTLTTGYQQRMTDMQFWLTVVFGATEVGFIASSIATWHYRDELGAVLAWALGATLVTAGALVALLRNLMNRK